MMLVIGIIKLGRGSQIPRRLCMLNNESKCKNIVLHAVLSSDDDTDNKWFKSTDSVMYSVM